MAHWGGGGGATGVPTSRMGHQYGVGREATVIRWTPCKLMGKMGDGLYEDNDERGGQHGQEGETAMKHMKEYHPRRHV